MHISIITPNVLMEQENNLPRQNIWKEISLKVEKFPQKVLKRTPPFMIILVTAVQCSVTALVLSKKYIVHCVGVNRADI